MLTYSVYASCAHSPVALPSTGWMGLTASLIAFFFLTLSTGGVTISHVLNGTLIHGGFTMWRHISVFMGLLVFFSGGGCSIDNTPKRLPAYLTPVPVSKATTVAKVPLPTTKISAVLVVINDHGFQKSAPALKPGTLQVLGEHLQSVLEKQVPIQLVTVVYPEALQPTGSSDQFVSLAKEQGVPYLLLAILSSSELEVSDRFPLGGSLQGGGGRGWLVGYRAENYARLELALLDAQTGQLVVNTDGQAWAVLERLAVPMESNVYPVVRRAQTQAPIYPNSEEDAFETLRWVSGQDAIAQAVMHLEEAWKKDKSS